MKTCPRCGYQTDNDNAKFCYNCGGKMPEHVAELKVPEVPEVPKEPEVPKKPEGPIGGGIIIGEPKKPKYIWPIVIGFLSAVLIAAVVLGVLFINKEATFLNVSETELTFKSEGGYHEVEIYTDGEWNCDAAFWANLSQDGLTLKIEVPENTDKESREAEIKITAGKLEKTIKITQEGALDPVLARLIDNMVLIDVEGRKFDLGATSGQGDDCDTDETLHTVMLSSYKIGRYEVTQEEWEAVMGSNPSHFKGAKRPVENVSWDDCQQFIRKLNAMTGKEFRLPTEAEWEVAAGGAYKARDLKYAGSNDIDLVAWYIDNSGNDTHEVGKKLPNEMGLYDMSGNVREWCSDYYDPNYYQSISGSTTHNPKGPGSGTGRVCRGGSYHCPASSCRQGFRLDFFPIERSKYNGLRLALDVEAKP